MMVYLSSHVLRTKLFLSFNIFFLRCFFLSFVLIFTSSNLFPTVCLRVNHCQVGSRSFGLIPILLDTVPHANHPPLLRSALDVCMDSSQLPRQRAEKHPDGDGTTTL